MWGVDPSRAHWWRLYRSTTRTLMSPSSPAPPVSVSMIDDVPRCHFLSRGGFDGGEHCPKLLSCSHTVCISCLRRIIATDARELGFRLVIVTIIKIRIGYFYFRCPICRELIRIPTGGVMAFPPSFLVNQLIDLMAKQKREAIPNCSVHNNQVLLHSII